MEKWKGLWKNGTRADVDKILFQKMSKKLIYEGFKDFQARLHKFKDF